MSSIVPDIFKVCVEFLPSNCNQSNSPEVFLLNKLHDLLHHGNPLPPDSFSHKSTSVIKATLNEWLEPERLPSSSSISTFPRVPSPATSPSAPDSFSSVYISYQHLPPRHERRAMDILTKYVQLCRLFSTVLVSPTSISRAFQLLSEITARPFSSNLVLGVKFLNEMT